MLNLREINRNKYEVLVFLPKNACPPIGSKVLNDGETQLKPEGLF